MNIEEKREDFPILKNNKELIYFDNAATSLKPIQVIEKLNEYYLEYNANIHRGNHTMSERASREFDEAQKNIGKFFDAKKEETIMVRNCSESINLLAYSLQNSEFLKKGDKIVITEMEHHSNIVPWYYLQKQGIKLEIIKVNKEFQIDEADFEKKIKEAKLVSMAHASNTIATINDVKKYSKKIHEEGALFSVDVAQSAPNMQISLKELGADFMHLSGHKMLAPTGTGAMISTKKMLEEMEPFLFGGDMIKKVSFEKVEWNELPWKFQAGTPDIGGTIAFGKAIDYLKKIGMHNIRKQEMKLTKRMIEELNKIESIKYYNPKNENKMGPIFMFEMQGLDCHDTSLLLNENYSIAIRSGMHCAEPIVSKINKEGLARASLYFYNTEKEIERFANALKEINSQIN